MVLLLIVIPLVMAGAACAVPSNRWRPWLVALCGLIELIVTVPVAWGPSVKLLENWIAVDPLSKVVLLLLNTLFFGCALYAPGYLALRSQRSNRVLCPTLLTAQSMMNLVAVSHHLGLMWVAMEATTLASAPFIYFNHNPRALEATWKYLLICSVGIALALLGSFFLAYASLHPIPATAGAGRGQAPFSAPEDNAAMPKKVPDPLAPKGITVHESSKDQKNALLFESLQVNARNQRLSKPWLQAAFVLLLVGYGTKMGLAPMHTWKPDAYGEAPGLVGALLAGGVTTCAFVAILRFFHIAQAGGAGPFARQLLLLVGLLSMAIGAVFMIRQRDFKRMLAYSSVEHMGILVIGIGLGGTLGIYGSLLHMINNGWTKGVLFLSAGNIHRAYGSKTTDKVRGSWRLLPLSSAMFLAGFFAITGSPPFGPFVSEFTIVSSAIQTGHFVVGALFLFLMAVVFVGMGMTVLAVVQGEPPADKADTKFRDGISTGLPIVLLMALVLLLGVCIPGPLDDMLRAAAQFVENPR
jgi:hydrogenase-4 component F